jgi:hypothetical protein
VLKLLRDNPHCMQEERNGALHKLKINLLLGDVPIPLIVVLSILQSIGSLYTFISATQYSKLGSDIAI